MRTATFVLLLVFSFVFVGVQGGPNLASGESEGDDRRETMMQLIRQLDADEFEVRERATQRLIEIGKPALAVVKEVLAANPTAEVRSRGQRIVKVIEQSIGNSSPTPQGSETQAGERKAAKVPQPLPNSNRLFIGRDGTRTLQLTGGLTRNTDEFATFGRGKESIGEVIVSDPGSTWAIGRFVEVAEDGRGLLTVRNRGKVQCKGWVRLATKPGSVANVNIRGAASMLDAGQRIEVGRAGSGSLTVEAGAGVHTLGWLRLATDVGSDAAFALRDADTTCSIAGWCKIACEGRATVDIVDAARLVVGEWVEIAEDPRSKATVLVTGKGSTFEIGGACKVGEEGKSDASIHVGNKAQLSCKNGMFLGKHARLKISNFGVVSIKRQLGVRSGCVEVVNNGSIRAERVNVGVGGRLSGDGTIHANVFNKGTLDPGNPTGKLRISGNFATEDSARLLVEVAPDQIDTVEVAGNASLAGVIEIRLTADHPQALKVNILTADAVESRFRQIVLPEALTKRNARVGYSETSVTLSFDAAE